MTHTEQDEAERSSVLRRPILTWLSVTIDNWKSKRRCFPWCSAPVSTLAAVPARHDGTVRSERCKCRRSGSRRRMTGPRVFFSTHRRSFSVRSTYTRLDPSHRLPRDGIRDEHSPQLFPPSADYRKSMLFWKWRPMRGKCNNVGSTPQAEPEAGLPKRSWNRETDRRSRGCLIRRKVIGGRWVGGWVSR